MMTCPECGATNPEGASWCNQCHVSLAPPAADPADAPEGTAPEAADPDAADSHVATAQRPMRPGFRRTGDTVEWQCVRCEEFNPIVTLNCQVCGTPLAARFEQPKEETPRNWPVAFLLSVVLPGAGHMAVGRYGSGSARALLFALWMTGAVLLTGEAAEAGRSAIAATGPLFLGSLVLWAASLIDLRQVQEGGRELLAGRNLLWLVVGVLILSAIGMFGAMVPKGGTGGDAGGA